MRIKKHNKTAPSFFLESSSPNTNLNLPLENNYRAVLLDHNVINPPSYSPSSNATCSPSIPHIT